MLMLPVYIQQQAGNLAQSGHGHCLIVDTADAPGRSQLSGYDYQSVLCGFHIQLPESLPFFLPCNGKHKLNIGVVCPGTYTAFRCLAAQSHGYGTDDNGFAGSGFTGEDIETLTEFHIRFLNKGQVLYMQFQ